MLQEYSKHAYSAPLSISDRDIFIKLCTDEAQQEGSMADSIHAALSLLHHMKVSSSLTPRVSSFALAAECVLAQHNEGEPAHQIIVQLQQEVWQHMQGMGLSDPDASAAYLPALDVVEGSEAVQIVLLMAQNGLGGLSGDCCLVVDVSLEDHHRDWVQDIFGTVFVDELGIVAEYAMDNPNIHESHQNESAWLKFPSHPLPKLSEAAVNDGALCFELGDGSTPWWMVPATAWQQSQSSGSQPLTQAAEEASPQVAQRSAAEQLVADFQHLEKGSKQKRTR